MISKIVRFAQQDLWRMRLGELKGKKFYLVKASRIAILSFRGFSDDICSLRASALTFYTLLSIIPVFAMAFGIAKGFGLQNLIERQIMTQLKGQEEVAKWIINFAYSFLENTQGGIIAGIGVVVLFWTIIRVLNSIESSFNAIWKTDSQRSTVRKITDYLSIMLIAPIFFIIASSVTVFIAKEVNTVIGRVSILSQFGPAIQFSLRLLPYLMTWLLFCFIYMVMPNTRVKLAAALLAGIIAGTVFQAFQYFYVNFQIGVSKYNAIYGSFAALPLFLVWLQTSWLILLYGAEISYAYQNVEMYEFEPDCANISYAQKKMMLLSVAYLIVKQFTDNSRSCSIKKMSDELDIPIILVRELVRELVKSGIVSETRARAGHDSSNDKSGGCYQPGLDIGKITISRVVRMWERHGQHDVQFGKSEAVRKISEKIQDLFLLIEQSPEDSLLKDI